VTAFGPNPDGAGTLLRLWELGGAGGTVTITLPHELEATHAQPVNLRGVAIGPPVTLNNHQLAIPLSAFAPVSFVLQ
jgi:hypothetical protein